MNDLFESLKLFEETRGETAAIITGAGRAYKAALAAYETAHEHARVLFVCENDYEAKNYYAGFSEMMDTQKLFFFPKRPLYFTYADSMSRSAVNDRIRTVKGFYENREMLVVTSIWALAENMPFFTKEDVVRFSVGETHGMREIAAMLVRYGYQREDRTESPGQFSVRGGILDVYSAACANPFRIEFDADEIDSIRSYNPETQLSIKNAAHADVAPFSEVLLDEQDYTTALKKFKTAAGKAARTLSESGEAEEIEADNASLIENFTADPSQGAAYIYMYGSAQSKSLLDIAEAPLSCCASPLR
jgi:transcription-repair coupling factor (superfamily II helicase)